MNPSWLRINKAAKLEQSKLEIVGSDYEFVTPTYYKIFKRITNEQFVDEQAIEQRKSSLLETNPGT